MEIARTARDQIFLNAASLNDGETLKEPLEGSPPDLRDMLIETQDEQKGLARDVESLKREYRTKDAEKNRLAAREKMSYLLGAAGAVGFFVTMATGMLIPLIGGAIVGVSGMILGITSHKKEIEMADSLAGMWKRGKALHDREVALNRRAEELQIKIASSEEEFNKLAESLSKGNGSTRLTEEDDQFVIIDGLKLEKRMNKTGIK